jgi:putative PIN family toxin of toxin-antitoxin system
MITAVLDTNVFVQYLIGGTQSASALTVEALLAGSYLAVFSTDTIDELVEVLSVSSMNARHGLSDDEILDFIASLLEAALIFPAEEVVSNELTRDVSDTKLLALVESASAAFLVTNDRRHLIRLKSHAGASIVTPARFLRALSLPTK